MPAVKTYRRKPHRLTINPMTTEERLRLLSELSTYDPSTRHPNNHWFFDPVKMLLLTYGHGMHISVLVHPTYWNVVVDVAKRELQWSRTKTHELIVHALSEQEIQWVPAFIESLRAIEPTRHKFTTQTYGTKNGERQRKQDVCYLRYARILNIVCKDIGLKGLSTRGIRHTLADRIDEGTGYDSAEIEEALGVTPNVARRYSNRRRTKARELMATGRLPL